jgi:ribonuclease T2
MPVSALMSAGKRFSAAFAGLLALAAISQAQAEDRPQQGFDFYVLSLSWSPSWCATHPQGQKTMQCDPSKDFGFIVHGLWPQNESGYPEFCATRESDRVPANLGRRYLDIIPSMGLIGHEWRKHGTCSGLKQADYLQTLRDAYNKVSIPPALAKLDQGKSANPGDIEKAFLAANPGMSEKGIAVSCASKMLQEVRICMTKDLQFRDCEEVDADACPLKSVNIPPVR